MTPTEYFSLAAVVVAAAALIYTALSNSHKEDKILEARVTLVETKVGLFWHLVEENLSVALAKANPIQLSEAEQAAAQIYATRKAESPTLVLKALDKAIKREIKAGYMDSNEVMIFTLVQSAIKSQLIDRREYEDA